jgi:hypothetical protein
VLKEELLELGDRIFFGGLGLGVKEILDNKGLINAKELVINEW